MRRRSWHPLIVAVLMLVLAAGGGADFVVEGVVPVLSAGICGVVETTLTEGLGHLTDGE